MRDKPVKRGYKVWMFCHEKGYNIKFDIYTGKLKNQQTEHGLGSKVVSKLVEELQGKGNIVFMDNYFSSYDLYLELLNNKTFSRGTSNQFRRKLSTLKNDKQLERGEYDHKTSDTNITFIKWKDRKNVHLLSSFHDPCNVTVVNRTQKDGLSKEVLCSRELHDYNLNMNFVDNFDRIQNEYHIDRKSKRWWLRIFFYFMTSCVTNTFICHREVEMEQLTFKNFSDNVNI